jgi:hypothetical protein
LRELLDRGLLGRQVEALLALALHLAQLLLGLTLRFGAAPGPSALFVGRELCPPRPVLVLED